jgi:serine/threonine protein kinase
MEIMSEGHLFEYVQTRSFLEEYEACIVMKQLVETLVYLKSLGLIHRDLKPENIMVH